ncbi:MAG TPA: hypothetical protein VF698_07250 [Thermoanaerobaculia bacterium]
MAKRTGTPYWLEGSDEICAGCEHSHSHHVNARCAGCDRSLCFTCRVTVGGEILCSECNKERRTKWRPARSGKVS